MDKRKFLKTCALVGAGYIIGCGRTYIPNGNGNGNKNGGYQDNGNCNGEKPGDDNDNNGYNGNGNGYYNGDDCGNGVYKPTYSEIIKLNIGSGPLTPQYETRARDMLGNGAGGVMVIQNDTPYKMFHAGELLDSSDIVAFAPYVCGDHVLIQSINDKHLKVGKLTEQAARNFATSAQIRNAVTSLRFSYVDPYQEFQNSNRYGLRANAPFIVKNQYGDFSDLIIESMHTDSVGISEAWFQQTRGGANIGSGLFNMMEHQHDMGFDAPRVTAANRNIRIVWTNGGAVISEFAPEPFGRRFFSTCFIKKMSQIIGADKNNIFTNINTAHTTIVWNPNNPDEYEAFNSNAQHAASHRWFDKINGVNMIASGPIFRVAISNMVALQGRAVRMATGWRFHR